MRIESPSQPIQDFVCQSDLLKNVKNIPPISLEVKKKQQKPLFGQRRGNINFQSICDPCGRDYKHFYEDWVKQPQVWESRRVPKNFFFILNNVHHASQPIQCTYKLRVWFLWFSYRIVNLVISWFAVQLICWVEMNTQVEAAPTTLSMLSQKSSPTKLFVTL